MHVAIAKRKARKACNRGCQEPQGPPSPNSSEGSVRGEEGSLEDRGISHETLDERSQVIQEQGLPVVLLLRELPEDMGAGRKHSEFVEDPNHPDGGYWHSEPPELLRIELKPLEGFTKLHDRRHPSKHNLSGYHIPLCYSDELHRFNLRDAFEGVGVARGVYERIRARYHGRHALLHGWLQGATLTLSRRTDVEGNRRGEHIVDDLGVRMLRAAGSFHDLPLQVGL